MTRRDTAYEPDGFALPAAILALIVVGVLVTGGFYMARQETRIGTASANSALAFYLAERGVTDVMESWDATSYASLDPWETVTRTDTTSEGIWSVDVTRVAAQMYMLEADARITRGGALQGGAHRSMGVIVKLRTADITPPAGLTTQGLINFGGSAIIKGADTPPDGSGSGSADWGNACDAFPTDDMPGLLIDDTTNIDWQGNRTNIEGEMTGDPKFTQDTTITSDNLLDFGDMQWAELTSLAGVTITSSTPPDPAPVVDGGRCVPMSSNWGDPLDTTSVCFDYYPIIHLNNPGETRLQGGFGQGILLVEGDLRVTGGFEFYGPVYVKGTLTTAGAGGHFWGGVVAANVDINSNTVLGDAEIQFSSCAVERAIRLNANLIRPELLAERSWIDVSGAGGS
ncbi:MAG: hypothetical protein RQ745_01715 [Longimicrobiales bacterium]|nr:hypothetical protein [Longimicrobiales bacterium]